MALGTSEPRNEASDSIFGDGLDLHEGNNFSFKKELMSKVTNVAFNENFEFQTIKSAKSFWVVQFIDSNYNW